MLLTNFSVKIVHIYINLKRIMNNEKTTLPSLRNIEWRTVKTKTNKMNQLQPYISINKITELNELIYAGVAVWMHYWTLTKCMEKMLDGNYTKISRAILNKSWRRHSTKQQLYSHLPPITKTIKPDMQDTAGELGTN